MCGVDAAPLRISSSIRLPCVWCLQVHACVVMLPCACVCSDVLCTRYVLCVNGPPCDGAMYTWCDGVVSR